MTAQMFRNPSGGRIDRGRPIPFSFDGRAFSGFEGDTLASALLANGVRLVGRSFKYHRPRGIMSAGAEEPNALVQVGEGAASEPNIRATQLPISPGLSARSQNAWPSLGFDLAAANDRLSGRLPAGFYYKTFMWPAVLWMRYERAIRAVAGLGKAPEAPDPDSYEHHHLFCDVLIAGGGPAGLAAALAAGRSGARVILAEQDEGLGGSLLSEPAAGPRRIDGQTSDAWLQEALRELSEMPEVRVLTRSVAFGTYDQNLVALCERETRLGPSRPGRPRHRLHHVRAARVVLATGSIERPLVYGGNDRPGAMLASAARTYVNRYAVRPGARALVFTNNDSAYEAAFDSQAAGLTIAALVDLREDVRADLAARARQLGIELLAGTAVTDTLGAKGIRAAEVMRLDGPDALRAGTRRRIDCDLLLSSGGWSPAVHLHSQAQGKLRYDTALAAFLPEGSPQGVSCAGSVTGQADLSGCLQEGARAGAEAARAAGLEAGFEAGPDAPQAGAEPRPAPMRALWRVPLAPGSRSKRFVDHQNDVTAEDIALAARENYASVEHMKRYTTLGMGTDQGKTGNINGLGVLALERGENPGALGTTTFRPPYTPVPLGALAGPDVGPRLAPVRRTPLHAWHERAGAVFVNSGQWLRARYYPEAGETMDGAVNREAVQVRQAAGICDVSTLGKIDVRGRDAGRFLDRIYTNGISTLKVGRCRYGLMLREDGIVYDDGAAIRLAEDRFLMSAATANAGPVLQELELALQVHWPEIEVGVASVTDLWASMSIAGPRAREVLSALESDIDVSNDALPFMGHAQGQIESIPAHVFRISFSGELGFELACEAGHGIALWEAVMAKGRTFGLKPYGVEALDVLRIEKGHVVIGNEIDGATTADDLGFGRLCSTKKRYIGDRLKDRPALRAADREQLVGVVPIGVVPIGVVPIGVVPMGGGPMGGGRIRTGMVLVADPDRPPPVEPPVEPLVEPLVETQGRVTSGGFSPNLDHDVGIALLRGGRARRGEELWAVSPLHGERTRVRVVSPHFIDPEGERLRA